MTRMRAITATLVVVAGSVVAVSAATSGSAQTPGPTVIALQEKAGGYGHFVDLPPKAKGRHGAPGAGDSFTFAGAVVDPSSKESKGTISGQCTFLKPGKSPVTQCLVSFTLADGTIDAAGNSNDTAPFDAAVIGGTGAYAGARGSIHVEHPKGGDLDTITLLP